MPGASDPSVLAWAAREQRILLTFDRDFGELAFRGGTAGSAGVILLRLTLPSPESAARRITRILADRSDWAGHFAVVDETRVRLRPLPSDGPA